jgi:hypothetical protein
MARARMKYANLDQKELEKVQTMEEQTGSVVLVVQEHYPVAQLNEQQIEQLKALEKELGVILIAYQR